MCVCVCVCESILGREVGGGGQHSLTNLCGFNIVYFDISCSSSSMKYVHA